MPKAKLAELPFDTLRDVLSKLGVPIGTGGGSYVHYCGRTESLFRKELFEEGEAIKLSLVHQSIYENVNGRHWLACQSRAGPSLRGRVWGGTPWENLSGLGGPLSMGAQELELWSFSFGNLAT